MMYTLFKKDDEVVMRKLDHFYCTFDFTSEYPVHYRDNDKALLNGKYHHIARLSTERYSKLPHILFADKGTGLLFHKSGMHTSGESSRFPLNGEPVKNHSVYIAQRYPVYPHTYTVVHGVTIHCHLLEKKYSITTDFELIASKDFNMDGLFRKCFIDEILINLP